MDDVTNKTFSHGRGEARLLVSIVILNYNGKTWLKRCLESIYSQTIFQDIEIIVADNASTDGSDQLAIELIAPWPGRANSSKTELIWVFVKAIIAVQILQRAIICFF